MFRFTAEVMEDAQMPETVVVDIGLATKDGQQGVRKMFHKKDLLVASLYDHISRSMLDELKKAYLED